MANEVRISTIGHQRKRLRLHLPTLTALLLSACASAPRILPVESTYPIGRKFDTTTTLRWGLPVYSSVSTLKSSTHPSINEEIRYSPGQTVLSSAFSGTKEGDDGLAELWIKPSGSIRSDERSLLDQVEARGQSACGAEARPLDTKYYYGPEATLKFIQINTPALKVVYRCRPYRQTISTTDGERLEQWAANEDTRFFDLSVYEFPTPPSVMVDALKAYAASNSWELELSSNLPADGIPQMISLKSTARRSIGISFVEQAYIAVADTGSSTRMTLLYMHFRTARHERGVKSAGTERPGFEWGLRPNHRDFTFSRAGIFVGDVLDAARKQ